MGLLSRWWMTCHTVPVFACPSSSLHCRVEQIFMVFAEHFGAECCRPLSLHLTPVRISVEREAGQEPHACVGNCRTIGLCAYRMCARVCWYFWLHLKYILMWICIYLLCILRVCLLLVENGSDNKYYAAPPPQWKYCCFIC